MSRIQKLGVVIGIALLLFGVYSFQDKALTESVSPTTVLDVTPFLILPPATTSTTTTVPPTTTVPLPVAKGSRGCPQFEPIFRKYGLLPVKTFSYIAWRESRCRIKAINAVFGKNGEIIWALNKNRTYDSGLLQVNSGHRESVKRICKADLDALLTLDCNLRVSKYLLNNGGLAHWSL
jgi:hypothetical protein